MVHFYFWVKCIYMQLHKEGADSYAEAQNMHRLHGNGFITESGWHNCALRQSVTRLHAWFEGRYTLGVRIFPCLRDNHCHLGKGERIGAARSETAVQPLFVCRKIRSVLDNLRGIWYNRHWNPSYGSSAASGSTGSLRQEP